MTVAVRIRQLPSFVPEASAIRARNYSLPITLHTDGNSSGSVVGRQSGWPRSWNQEFGCVRNGSISNWICCNRCGWEARRELFAESHKHPGVKLLRQIPSIGPIRSALLVALLQTPHRFRTKRQLWAYSGFAVETHDSGEYRSVRGKLQRNRERMTVRGLNDNHNRDLKNLFKVLRCRPAPVLARCATFMWLGLRKGCGRPWPVLPWLGR